MTPSPQKTETYKQKLTNKTKEKLNAKTGRKQSKN